MSAPGRERYDDICDALTAWHDDVRRSVIFGMPCLKKSGRVIAGFPRSGLGMVFKLTDPDAHARALALPGAQLFDPSGRGEPFKQWVVVPPEQADEWEPLAIETVAGAGTRAGAGERAAESPSQHSVARSVHAPRWENHDPASSSR